MRDDVFLVGPLIGRTFQLYWRLTRGTTLAAEACVLDPNGQVLLARSPGRNDWRLPGDIVRKGETLEGALRRNLLSEFGIEATGSSELFWIYVEPDGRQTGLFMVRHWRQQESRQRPPTGEHVFLFPELLSGRVQEQTAARIRQALEGRTPAEV